MTESNFPFPRIAVAGHPLVAGAAAEAEAVADFLEGQGAQAAHGLLSDEGLRQRVGEGDFDLLIALGGDGSVLRAGHLCAPCGVPILGINLGRFGFLVEIQRDQWREVLPRLFTGEHWLEHRMMLCAEQWRGEESLGVWEVLNEAMVGRGEFVRPVRLHLRVDDRYLTSYVADGLIVATPTGSTAYALAAGGPVLPPELRNILIVPVAPHISFDRAIVLAEGASVSVTVHTDHEAGLSVDGQNPVKLLDGDRIDLRASEHTVKFVRLQDPSYFYRNLTSHMNRNPTAGATP